jgi:hypothetical protein
MVRSISRVSENDFVPFHKTAKEHGHFHHHLHVPLSSSRSYVPKQVSPIKGKFVIFAMT